MSTLGGRSDTETVLSPVDEKLPTVECRVRNRVQKGVGTATAALRRAALGRLIVMSRPELDLFVQHWYHDFTSLGLPTPQRWGMFGPNQVAKQEPLCRLVSEALRLAGDRVEGPTVLELFCADGFYAIYAAQHGAGSALGIDTDAVEVAKAQLAANLLGVANANFQVADVLTSDARADVGICAGGLYHLTDPAALLARLRRQIDRVLVIQTVVHLTRTEPDYFETPAPGLTWGSRFSYEYLITMVEGSGWRIVSAERNELTGNDRPEDRGSAYLLCVPAAL
jgi:predicted RNA methylase